jgi:hypothetical protein
LEKPNAKLPIEKANQNPGSLSRFVDIALPNATTEVAW